MVRARQSKRLCGGTAVATPYIGVGRPQDYEPLELNGAPLHLVARFFFSSRFTQLSIRFFASARASFREPLNFTTVGLPPMLSGNEISRTHSFLPRPARMTSLPLRRS
jgi:hypothetical protein